MSFAIDWSPYSARVKEQALFNVHCAYLQIWAFQNGFVLTYGEAARTVEQQRLHFNAGRSMTMNSKHIERLAIDFNVFKNGKLCTAEEIKPMGDYWRTLDPANVWGGDWNSGIMGGSGKRKLVDGPHFQRGR
jgi:D-alanyl-D-alanine carboxypeptidase